MKAAATKCSQNIEGCPYAQQQHKPKLYLSCNGGRTKALSARNCQKDREGPLPAQCLQERGCLSPSPLLTLLVCIRRANNLQIFLDYALFLQTYAVSLADSPCQYSTLR